MLGLKIGASTLSLETKTGTARLISYRIEGFDILNDSVDCNKGIASSFSISQEEVLGLKGSALGFNLSNISLGKKGSIDG